jgi:hypothetical protein
MTQGRRVMVPVVVMVPMGEAAGGWEDGPRA